MASGKYPFLRYSESAVSANRFDILLRSGFRISGKCAKVGSAKSERPRHEDLLRRVRKMLFAPDHVRDFHQGIIHDHGKIIKRRINIFRDHLVAKKSRVKDNFAAYHIIEFHFHLRKFESDHLRFLSRGRFLKIPAMTVVFRR